MLILSLMDGPLIAYQTPSDADEVVDTDSSDADSS